MRLPLLFLSIAVLVVGLGGPYAPAAIAQSQDHPRVVQTDCDTLSLSPPLVRVEFGVINLGPIPVCSVHLTPIDVAGSDADSCRIVGCSSPPGWACELDPATGGAWWHAESAAGSAEPPDCIDEGEKHEPFDIVLDPLFCCYRVEFNDPNGVIFYTDTVCFECEKPVPAESATWGRLKSLYR